MSGFEPALSRLRAMARGWGGDIKETTFSVSSFDAPPGISHCPFDGNLAVDFDRMIVLYSGANNLGSLIHEMGHAFASRKFPAECNEWRFFGWEYVVARRAGCADVWLKSSDDYQVEGGRLSFGTLTREKQRSVLAERIRFSRKNGTIKGGRPVSIRGRQ